MLHLSLSLSLLSLLSLLSPACKDFSCISCCILHSTTSLNKYSPPVICKHHSHLSGHRSSSAVYCLPRWTCCCTRQCSHLLFSFSLTSLHFNYGGGEKSLLMQLDDVDVACRGNGDTDLCNLKAISWVDSMILLRESDDIYTTCTSCVSTFSLIAARATDITTNHWPTDGLIIKQSHQSLFSNLATANAALCLPLSADSDGMVRRWEEEISCQSMIN